MSALIERYQAEIDSLVLEMDPVRSSVMADTRTLHQLVQAAIPSVRAAREAHEVRIQDLKSSLGNQNVVLQNLSTSYSMLVSLVNQAKSNLPILPKPTIVKPEISKLLPLYRKTKDTEKILIDDFIRRVETILQGFSVPEDLKLAYFYHTLLDSPLEQQWVLDNVKSRANLTWGEAKVLIVKEFLSEQELQNRIGELNSVAKMVVPRVESMEHYASRFSVLYRSTGKNDKDPSSLLDQELFCKSLKPLSRVLINCISITKPPICLTDIYKYAISTDIDQYQKKRTVPDSFEKRPDPREKEEPKNSGVKPCRYCSEPFTFGHNRVCKRRDLNAHHAAIDTNQDSEYNAYIASVLGLEESEDIAQECAKKNIFSSDCSGNIPNELSKGKQYRVPILVQGSRINALHDSGCTTTTLDSKLAKQLNIVSVPIILRMSTFEGSNTGTYYRSKYPVDIRCGSHTINLIVLVRNLGPDVLTLLGTDACDQFGIVPTGIPIYYPDHVPPSKVESLIPVPTCVDTSVSDRFAIERKSTLAYLDRLIQTNKAIAIGQFCNLPGSVVDLDISDTQNKYLWKRQYPIPQAVSPMMTERVNDWLTCGVIKFAPLNNPYNCPIFPIFDRDQLTKAILGIQRIVIDPRPINALITGDRFPVPIVTDIFQKVGRFFVLTELDLRKSFNQFRLSERSQKFLAFTWNGSQYVFVGCPFGLKPLSSVFQRVMKTLFKDLTYVEVFIDNIIVHSNSILEHQDHLFVVMELLNRSNLKLNFNKCQWLQTKLVILGHSLSSTGLQIDPEKLQAALEIPAPKTGKQVMAMLGLFNYFRSSIPRYAEIAQPLEKLRYLPKIDREWTQQCSDALEKMKFTVSQNIQLIHADFAEPFFVATDASLTGVGGVLYQIVDGHNRYIKFVSRALTSPEEKQDALRRELLGIVYCLRSFHYFLWGRRFTLYTDSRSLTFMFSQKELTPMLLQYSEIILDYDFEPIHRPGVQNVLPDALSRIWPSSSLTALEPTLSNFMALADFDSFVVPEKESRFTLLERAHLLGHYGSKALVDSLKDQGVGWPGIHQDALKHVEECFDCQKFSVKKSGFHPLRSITAILPCDHMAIDLAGPFEKSPNGNVFLLVCVDVATRFVFLRPLKGKEQSDIAAPLFEIFCTVGFPKILQSDNGTEFVNGLLRAITTLSTMDHRVILPYNPQANGVAEANVKITKTILYKLLKGFIQGWDRFIPSVQYAMNVKVVQFHGSSPFSLMMARSHNLFQDYSGTRLHPISDDEMIERIQFMNSIVFPAIHDKVIAENQNKIQKYASKRKIVPWEYFKIDEYVLHLDTNVTKLDPKWKPRWHKCQVAGYGPYGTYVLKNLDGSILARDSPPSHIRKFRQRGSATKSYEFVRITNHAIPPELDEKDAVGTDYLYQVQWSNGVTSWEPVSQFDDLTAVTLYWKRRRDKPPPTDYMCPKRPAKLPETMVPGQSEEMLPKNRVPHENTILAQVETTLDGTTMDDEVKNVETIHPASCIYD